MYMRIKSSNKIKLDSILSAQNVKCKVTKGRQILSGHPNLTYATTVLIKNEGFVMLLPIKRVLFVTILRLWSYLTCRGHGAREETRLRV